MTELPTFIDLTTDARPRPVTPFGRALHAFLDDLFVALPTLATSTGFHGLDDRWPDLSEAGRAARLALYDRHATALRALAVEDLSPDEAIDRGNPLSPAFITELNDTHGALRPLFLEHEGRAKLTALERMVQPGQDDDDG